MLKKVIEKALEGEMDAHLDSQERLKGNKRNGHGKKTLKSGFGSFDIDTPQDRQSRFEPEFVKKRQTILADNLKGFTQAILSLFPKTEVRLCIVHQIRNSLKYIASKDQKEFMKDLKKVYRAVSKQVAGDDLLALAEKGGGKYPVVIESQERNWEHLSQYFQYSEPIRRIIYTTNAVEGFRRQVRKVTKTKGVFTNDMALLKLVYLATKNIEKKWTAPLHSWGLTIQQLYTKFGERIPRDFVLLPSYSNIKKRPIDT